MKKLFIFLLLIIASQGYSQKIEISKNTKKLYDQLIADATGAGLSKDDAIRSTLENPEYKKLLQKDLGDSNKKANKKGITYSKNFGYIALHKKVAIIPFVTDITDNKTKKKKQSKKQRIEDESDLSTNAQQGLYNYLMKKQFDYSVEFQDPKRTNQLLKASGVLKMLSSTTDDQLAEILGVDAVIRGEFAQEINKGASTVALLASPIPLKRAKTTGYVTLAIGDGETGDVLWRIDMERKEGGSDVNDIIDHVMKQVSKLFPYSIDFSRN